LSITYQLRDYQRELLQAAIEGFQTDRSILLQLPTGGGKTICFSHLIKANLDGGLKFLILAHREELILQAMDKVQTITNQPVGIIKAGYEPDYSRSIQIASVQSLKNRLKYCPVFNLIIIDECHHATAASYRKILNHFPTARVLGVSATPCRLDGTGFEDLFSRLFTGVTTRQLIDMGSLSPYKYFAPERAMSLIGVKKSKGDYKSTDVEQANPIGNLTGDIVKCYRDYMDGKQAVVFCISVEYSIAIAAHFNAAGIKSAHLDGSTSGEDRAETMAKFRSGEINVLSNCALFDEGLDIPGLDGVILARPTASLGRYLQMVGRALRVSEGKEQAIVIDLAGNWERHGLPDDDRIWSLEGVKTFKRTQSKLKRSQQTGQIIDVAIDLTPTGMKFIQIGNPLEITPELGKWFERVDRLVNAMHERGERKMWCAERLLKSDTQPPMEAWQYLGIELDYHPGWAKYKFVEWEEPKNYDEDDEDDYYEEDDNDYYGGSNDYYKDEDKERMRLDLYWDRIIQKIYPTPRNIFTVFGRIESIVDNKVIIRMKDENLKKYAIDRLPELAKAFSEDRNQTMSIEFIV
jgi:superfamily II DNA or RNA helicase